MVEVEGSIFNRGFDRYEVPAQQARADFLRGYHRGLYINKQELEKVNW